ncbi:uncharacterized protein FFE2_08578 [Fusarium fujikuroi]|uniref:Uncharacterized protein n=1 Tax=Fusarium fujikuroi TaxID=5127 RepID=A0A9Q9RRH7_FUSFU|nr:uncharacterized protein FFE2_08578 [Fusarium fujikuroi]VTT74589.1 unnamed protein product [Fusarium fujikuroi]
MSDGYESVGSVSSDSGLDRLNGIMESFADSEDPRSLRFGHLVVPVYLRTAYYIEAYIIAALCKVDSYSMIFVMPRTEQRVSCMGDLELPMLSQFDQRTLQHSWFLKVLEMNYVPGPPSSWKQSDKMFAWEDDLVLPRRAFVVFQLDPYMSAECSLALAGLVKWANDVSKMQGAKIRVLTVSSLFGNGLLTDLVQSDFPVVHYELPIPTHVDLSPPGVIHYAGGDGILRRIQGCLRRARANERHAILVCPPSQRGDPFDEWSATLARSELLNRDMLDGESMISELTHPRTIRDVNPKAVVISVDAEHQIPGFLLDFTHAHIVLGKRRMRRVLDEDTGLVVLADVALTQTEIDTARWWCWQPEIDAQKVFIYPGVDGSVPDEDAAVYFGFHVEHAQAGGFIIAVLASDYGNADHVLRCFIRSPFVIPNMARRLQLQRIIHDRRSPDEPLQLAYTECEERTFAAVVSLVRYDYRLAHLIALESSDYQVRRLKAQLAVFLVLKNEWDLKFDPSICMTICTWGWGKPSWGDLWKVFGMWKLISRDCQDFETLEEPISDSSGAISLSYPAAVLFHRDNILLELALNKLGERFDVGLPAHRIKDESESLSDDQMKEVSRCLLSAFLNELVVTQIVASNDGESRLEHTIFSTRINVELRA